MNFNAFFFAALLTTTLMRVADAQRCCTSGTLVCCSGRNIDDGTLVLNCSRTCNDCDGGMLQCCATVAGATDTTVQLVADRLGANLQEPGMLEIGLNCDRVYATDCGF